MDLGKAEKVSIVGLFALFSNAALIQKNKSKWVSYYLTDPKYQLIEKDENIAKRNFFDFVCFRSGLKVRVPEPKCTQ